MSAKSDPITAAIGVALIAGTAVAQPAGEPVREPASNVVVEVELTPDGPVYDTTSIRIPAISKWLTVDPVPQPRRDRVWTGSVTSQADFDSTLNNPGGLFAASARSQFGVDGSGIRIGVISDSYNANRGASAGIASGDLPTNVSVLRDDFGFNRVDEGRAMIELIHDLAPGAEILFHSAFNNTTLPAFEASIAFAVDRLIAAGADIIVDDVAYLDQPIFQDGLAGQAADRAFAAGVAFFSATGNSGQEAWRGPARFESNNGRPEHDFSGSADTSRGDYCLDLRIEPFGGITVVVQWDQPFRSVGSPPGFAYTDIDASLIDIDTGQVLDFGFDDQIGETIGRVPVDPVELMVAVNNTGQFLDVGLVIDRFAGNSDDIELSVIVFDGDITDNSDLNSSTIFGHPMAAGAFGTAAQSFSSQNVQGFSSRGPVLITRDTSGNRVNVPRDKPDATATDGGNTTFFGTDSGADADSFPNFFGTSAAAPHAAAVAALALQYADSVSVPLTTQELYDLMKQTATPFTSFGSSPARVSGAGRIDAVALLQSIDDLVVPPPPPADPVDFNGDGVVNITDLFAYITEFTSPDAGPEVDFNGDGATNISDLFAFINAFTAAP
ncbi:MAG: S8 family serine peptidase [Planctomycetota bacterium]